MNHFYIIGNEGKDTNLAHMERIQKEIISLGGTCVVHPVNAFAELKDPNTLKDIPADTECILILGGDGTLIRSANATVKMGIPLVGINFGTMGYLCDIDEQNISKSIKQMMQDDYFVENRMMLSGIQMTGQQEKDRNNALNDIVIYRYGDLRVVDFVIYVNGSVLNTFSADGIIVATPTGSTGYSMSCGGPIVDPAAQMILITPISPHTLNSRSIVLNAEDEIIVEIGSRHRGQPEDVKVSFDGDRAETMNVGDRVIISKSEDVTRLIKLHRLSFLENISRKMQEN